MSRAALLEWIAVAVLLIGCSLVTAGVITIVFSAGVAAVLIVVGAVVAVIGGLLWTVIVKGATRRARSNA